MTATPASACCNAGDAPCNPSRRMLLIATAGAYGRVMASHYNLRPPADEVVV